ncbi:MAG TPA: hypothetical protein VK041_01445 [Opitutales bacterium]|nr:hypothetical protein [Opitutales bacterium]
MGETLLRPEGYTNFVKERPIHARQLTDPHCSIKLLPYVTH